MGRGRTKGTTSANGRIYGEHVIAVVLSLVAALLFAVSAAMQQRAASEAAHSTLASDVPRRSWLPVSALLHKLLRNRRWLLGWVTNLAGFAAHAVALHFGTITLVQALLLAQLMFALVLARRRPVWRDWLGTVAVCCGLILLLVIRRDPQPHPSRAHVPFAVLVVVSSIVVLLTAARLLQRNRPHLRGALVGVAAGMCFSLTAIFVVMATADLSRGGVGALLTDWVTLGLAVSTTSGTVLVQDAFAAGSLATALTAMAIADPVTSAVVEMLFLDVGQPPGLLTLLGYVGVGAVLTCGVVLLANSPTRQRALRPLAEEADQSVPTGPERPDPTGPERPDRADPTSASKQSSSPLTVADHG